MQQNHARSIGLGRSVEDQMIEHQLVAIGRGQHFAAHRNERLRTFETSPAGLQMCATQPPGRRVWFGLESNHLTAIVTVLLSTPATVTFNGTSPVDARSAGMRTLI